MNYKEWTKTARFVSDLEEEVCQGLNDYAEVDEDGAIEIASGWLFDDGAYIVIKTIGKRPLFHVHVACDELTTQSFDDAKAFLWANHSWYNYNN